jgi:hypothetical protein
MRERVEEKKNQLGEKYDSYLSQRRMSLKKGMTNKQSIAKSEEIDKQFGVGKFSGLRNNLAQPATQPAAQPAASAAGANPAAQPNQTPPGMGGRGMGMGQALTPKLGQLQGAPPAGAPPKVGQQPQNAAPMGQPPQGAEAPAQDNSALDQQIAALQKQISDLQAQKK